jgi:hypothetical protein
MSAAAYGKGIEKFMNADVDWLVDDIKAVLVDLNDYGAAITAATNATPIVITSNSHGLSNNMRVLIHGVLGNTAANGVFRIANVTTNTFELKDLTTGASVAGNGAYTSGGYIVKLDVNEFLSDITAGARISTSPNLSSKTNSLGVLDAADFSFTSVSGDPSELIVYYKDTGSAATSPLLFATTWAAGVITPDGNNINVTISSSGIYRALGGS